MGVSEAANERDVARPVTLVWAGIPPFREAVLHLVQMSPKQLQIITELKEREASLSSQNLAPASLSGDVDIEDLDRALLTLAGIRQRFEVDPLIELKTVLRVEQPGFEEAAFEAIKPFLERAIAATSPPSTDESPRRDLQRALLPVLDKFVFSVDLRIAGETDQGEFQLVPVVIARLGFDEMNPVVVQIPDEELELLVEELTEVLEQRNRLESSFKDHLIE